MAKEVFYVCDRCKHKQTSTQGFGPDTENPRFFYSLGLVIKQGDTNFYQGSAYVDRSAYVDKTHYRFHTIWCDKCLDEVGIKNVNEYNATATMKPETTFEDILRNMIREEAEDVFANKQ